MDATLDPDGRFAKQAVALVEAEKERLAMAIARQVRIVVPGYEAIDATAQIKNTITALDCVGDLMLRNRTERLAEFVEGVVAIRSASGFAAGDFLVGSLCFLPVLRRFFIHRAGNTNEGLIMFELLEGVLLPFVGCIVETLIECGTDATDPNGIDHERFLSLLSDSFEETESGFHVMPIASVDDDFPAIDDDDGESTAPGFR